MPGEEEIKAFERIAENVITPDFINEIKWAGIGLVLIGFGLIGLGWFPEWSGVFFIVGLMCIALYWYVHKNFKVVEVNGTEPN